MKNIFFIIATVIACLCLNACSEQDISTSSSIGQPDSYGSSVSRLENYNSSESNSESSDKNDGSYTIENTPLFDVSFDGINKIYAYDAALGEGWTVTDPKIIELIIEKIRSIIFYNETPSVDPAVNTLSHQCFEYFEFYKNQEDVSPIFCMGLDPFYIETEDEKFGPFVADISDNFVTELLKLFLTGR